ncbi:MAG: hypothetical protein Nk1A_6730 [Endomicrobiia bacterium]|nr:MAG: hypothetical protein Nk1A_6730 [Endomicrobiia bacterium]
MCSERDENGVYKCLHVNKYGYEVNDTSKILEKNLDLDYTVYQIHDDGKKYQEDYRCVWQGEGVPEVPRECNGNTCTQTYDDGYKCNINVCPMDG